MKKTVLILTLLLTFSGLVYAHPPQEITINYNQETKLVSVKITHPTPSVDSHYINKVKIYLNSKLIIEQKINTQIESKSQLLKYQIPDAELGSNLKVEASCNRFGTKSKTVTLK